MTADEFAPTVLPIGEDSAHHHRDYAGQGFGVDIDRVGISAAAFAERFDP
ncbi:hypothetical protein IU450_27780 [Nocardia abscessus]|nr:hypothetical protein [Nocardia abscessus]MBF6339668.1 hypothetical protein [Nocardia abscessus]